jgi:DNA mismatch repair protein MutS
MHASFVERSELRLHFAAVKRQAGGSCFLRDADLNDQTPIRTEGSGPAAGPAATPMPAAAGATPMMEQFIEIKAANPDCLLFYRMGDFYELFFEDAEIASRALGIVLTKRGKHQGHDIPMCGVPVHAADDYLQKLIGLGHRVAVCEQIEDPAEAKKRGAKSVVKRDVIRLVTPGTITEDRLLEPAESNFLMALGRVKGSSENAYALAWIELSTGVFRVAETNGEALAADIFRVDPRELIVAEPVFHDDELKPLFDMIGRVASPQPPSLFDSASAPGRIARFYGVATPDSFGTFSRTELSAISGIVAYVEKTQKAERPPLSRPEREHAGSSLFIDPATRANLELLRTMSGSRDGSLIRAVDRTVTGAGARLLADRLMSPLTNPKAINQRLDSVAFFASETRLCGGLRACLKEAADMPRALTRLALNRGAPRDLGALRSGFEAALQLRTLFADAELPAELKAALGAISALPVRFADQLGAALADELPLLKRDGGFVRSGYHPELDEMRALRDEARKVIAAMERELIEETGIRSLKIRHNNVLGYYIEVTANHQDRMTGAGAARGKFIHRQTMANAMRFTTTELAEMETKIANAADRALAIELHIFDALTAEAVEHAEPIRAGALALAVLDVSAALAVLANGEAWKRPLVDDSLAFEVSGGRHPVVEQAIRGERLRPVAGGRRQERRDLAADRPEYGRQVDLPAPECADRHSRADRFLRAGEIGAHRRRRPVVQPCRCVGRPGARALDLHGRDGRDGRHPQSGGREKPRHSRRDRPRHRHFRRPIDRLGGGRISAREEPLPGDLRHAFPRDDGAGRQAPAPAQRHHAGEGVGRRRRLPARGGQGRGRPLLRRAGGAARRPAGRGGAKGTGRAAPTRGRRDVGQGRPPSRRPAAVFGRGEARGAKTGKE